MPFKDRLEVNQHLVDILGSEDRVYYQPPTGEELEYPCFAYTVKDGETWHADNNPYQFFPMYDVTHIYKNPDEGLAMTKKLVSETSGVRYDRAWRVDNLYHENVVVW